MSLDARNGWWWWAECDKCGVVRQKLGATIYHSRKFARRTAQRHGFNVTTQHDRGRPVDRVCCAACVPEEMK